MRVSGGKGVCQPLAPALTRAVGKMGGDLHCGWMGGGGGRAWRKGNYLPSLLWRGIPHPQQRAPHPGYPLGCFTHLGLADLG